MGIRLKSLYYSDSDVAYGIEIHDADLPNDPARDFDMPKSGAPKIIYDNDETDIFNPIVSSSCKFTMWVDDVYHRAFFTLLSTSSEGRFFLRVYYLDGTTEITVHIGNILHDTVFLEESKDAKLQIHSVDPLMEFDNKDYAPKNPVGNILDLSVLPYDGIFLEYTLMTSACIQYFFPNDTDVVLEVLNEYKSQNAVDGSNMFQLTRLKNYFKKSEEGRPIERESALSVMSEILRSLGSRIYFDSGRYFIEQIGARVNSSMTTSFYNAGRLNNFTGVSLGTSHDLTWSSEISTDAAPRVSLLPPIQRVVLEQIGDFRDNLLFNQVMLFDSVETPVVVDTIYSDSQALKIFCSLQIRAWRDITYNDGTLQVQTYDDDQNDPNNPLTVLARYTYVRISLRISVGNKYLTGFGVLNYSTGANNRMLAIDDAVWSSDSADRLIVMAPVYNRFSDLNVNADNYIQTVDIVSPVMESTGDVVFSSKTIEAPLLEDAEGGFSPDPLYTDLLGQQVNGTINWISSADSLTVVNSSGTSDNTGSTFTTLLNDENNTIVLNANYSMGSFPDTSSIYRVFVWDGVNSNNDFEEYEESVNWVHPDFGSMPYQHLAIHDMLAIRSTVRRRLDISLHLPDVRISMRTRLIYDGRVYIPFYLNFHTAEDIVSGLWMDIAKVTSSVPPVEEDFPDLPTNLLGNGVVNGFQSSATSDIDYYKLIEDINSDYVDVSDYSDLPNPGVIDSYSIRRSMFVFLGAAKQRYKNTVRENLKTGEFRINYTEKRLEWKRSVSGKTVELYIRASYESSGSTS